MVFHVMCVPRMRVRIVAQCVAAAHLAVQSVAPESCEAVMSVVQPCAGQTFAVQACVRSAGWFVVDRWVAMSPSQHIAGAPLMQRKPSWCRLG